MAENPKLALRLSGALDKVASGMLDIGKMLPRFEAYQILLPESPRLKVAILELYVSIVQFSLDAIFFFCTYLLSMESRPLMTPQTEPGSRESTSFTVA